MNKDNFHIKKVVRSHKNNIKSFVYVKLHKNNKSLSKIFRIFPINLTFILRVLRGIDGYPSSIQCWQETWKEEVEYNKVRFLNEKEPFL